jgi:pimeloyl-ACP methyl ester carboxylesterase
VGALLATVRPLGARRPGAGPHDRQPGAEPAGAGADAGFDALDRLATVDCPTLVCVGELDPVTPVAAARELVAALPGGMARLEVVQEAGHFTWKDAPDRYWPLLVEFVTNPGLPRDIETVYRPYQDEQLDR